MTSFFGYRNTLVLCGDARCNAVATVRSQRWWHDEAGGTGAATVNLDYRILGPIEVWAGGQQLDIGGARQRRLLGALVLARRRPLTAERLVDIVWAGEPPTQARNTLRTYIARARRVLEVNGDAPLVTDPNGWRLERADDAVQHPVRVAPGHSAVAFGRSDGDAHFDRGGAGAMA